MSFATRICVNSIINKGVREYVATQFNGILSQEIGRAPNLSQLREELAHKRNKEVAKCQ